MGNGGAALGAEQSVDNVAGGALGSGVGLDGAVDGELVLLNDSNKGCRESVNGHHISGQVGQDMKWAGCVGGSVQ